MNAPHCPSCGTPFVRVTYDEGLVERVLTRFKVFPFRCQLCTERFHSFWAEPAQTAQTVDRRQYKRLPASFRADIVADTAQQADHRVTDISMGGCTLETAALLPRGTFFELMIKPVSDDQAIKVERAMVCSTREDSMGIRFLKLQPNDKQRLSQVVLNLLVGQNLQPQLLH
jgi:c-di-GMP-binding flagellar brake protein YcgR